MNTLVHFFGGPLDDRQYALPLPLRREYLALEVVMPIAQWSTGSWDEPMEAPWATVRYVLTSIGGHHVYVYQGHTE